MAEQSVKLADGCETVGEIKVVAWVWTVAVFLGSIALVYNLAKTDRWMYDSKGQYPHPEPHRENRRAQTSLPSETLDARKASTLPLIEGALRE